MAKFAEIERIARSFRGVGEAFAVQGGREVRVYVEEEHVSDAGAAKLAADIAQVISREMTFPDNQGHRHPRIQGRGIGELMKSREHRGSGERRPRCTGGFRGQCI